MREALGEILRIEAECSHSTGRLGFDQDVRPRERERVYLGR